MSREVVGLAPDDAVVQPRPRGPLPVARATSEVQPAVLVRAHGAVEGEVRPEGGADPASPNAARPSAEPPAAQAPDAQRARRGRSRRSSRLGLALVTAVAASAAFGWTGSATWTAARQRDTLMRGASASATLLDMTGRPDQLGAAVVVARVRVVNVGTVPITVTGAERGFLAARIEQVGRVPSTVATGATLDLQLLVHVDCASPQQLAVPPLTVRRPDGVLRPLQIEGAAAELVRTCNLGPANARTVLLKDIRTDGQRLKLVLVVPSGRTVRVSAITAGELALTGRPLPGTVDGQSRTIWLDPPPVCPVSWRTQGLPRTLDLTIDGTINNVGRAHVSIEAGYPLPAWLLATACGGRLG